MRITVLYGANPAFDYGLKKVTKIISDTLKELGVDLFEVQLFYERIPYYDGVKCSAVDKIVAAIKQSDGVVFATGSSSFAPWALMQTFMEYLDGKEYKGALQDKNCLVALISKNNGDRFALDCLCRNINLLGGYDSVKICLDAAYTKDMEREGTPNREILEKQVEDFYRAVNQNRRFFIPTQPKKYAASASLAESAHDSAAAFRNMPQMQPTTDDYYNQPFSAYPNMEADSGPFNAGNFINDNQPKRKRPVIDEVSYQTSDISSMEKDILLGAPAKMQKQPVSDVYRKLDLDSFNERQEDDINELTEFFAKKYSEPKSSKNENTFKAPLNPKEQKPMPRNKTCRQASQSLPHRFQPQLSSGTNAVIQLNIRGEEAFDGYILINNTECIYEEGENKNQDITIMADSSVWYDVLKGKFTAQKAFMIGQLKVRGNFILLTKFDQLFKTL